MPRYPHKFQLVHVLSQEQHPNTFHGHVSPTIVELHISTQESSKCQILVGWYQGIDVWDRCHAATNQLSHATACCNTHALRSHDSASLTGLTSATHQHCVPSWLTDTRATQDNPEVTYDKQSEHLEKSDVRSCSEHSSANHLGHVSDVRRTVGTLTQFRNAG